MKKITISLLILVSIVFITSCSSYRGAAGGGCQVTRNMSGYR